MIFFQGVVESTTLEQERGTKMSPLLLKNSLKTWNCQIFYISLHKLTFIVHKRSFKPLRLFLLICYFYFLPQGCFFFRLILELFKISEYLYKNDTNER